VAPAAFAALIAGHLTELPTAELPARLAAIAAAALVARRTGSHLIAVVAAGLAWSLLSLW
jgi:hypothetical protein